MPFAYVWRTNRNWEIKYKNIRSPSIFELNSFWNSGYIGVDTTFIKTVVSHSFYHTPIACKLYQLKRQTSDVDPTCMKTKQYKPFSGVSITEHFCCSRLIKEIISSNKRMQESKHPVLNDQWNIIAQQKQRVSFLD